MYTILFIILFASAFVTAVILPCVVSLAHKLHLYDMPDSRKIHAMLVPRLGGVVFLPVVTMVVTVTLVILLRINYNVEMLWDSVIVHHFLAYMFGAMALYAVGMYDDIYGVGYRIKFLVQIAAGTALCVSGLWISNLNNIFFIHNLVWWVGMPLTVFFVVYVTNAINLIDGIDGLASGLSAISLAVIALLNMMAGSMIWAMLAVAYLGVVLIFFYYNEYGKAYKTFMGDAGSLTLGYTLAFLVLHFLQSSPVWNPYIHNVGVVAMSTLVIPMLDVVRVLLSRIRDHRNPFLPDKNHIHHKLLRAGLSPFMTMVTLLTISVAIIIINYFMAAYISPTVMIFVDMFLFCLMHLYINVAIGRKERGARIQSRIYSSVGYKLYSLISRLIFCNYKIKSYLCHRNKKSW